jgi:hypothetical protein
MKLKFHKFIVFAYNVVHFKHIWSMYKLDEKFSSIFMLNKKNSSYLYVFQTHLRYITFVCKMYKLMKKWFSYDFHYQIMW